VGTPQYSVGQTGTLLRCVECGAESDQLATGWRAYLGGELEVYLLWSGRVAGTARAEQQREAEEHA
jgi:hypothetical protein